jgi:hypothetical protein
VDFHQFWGGKLDEVIISAFSHFKVPSTIQNKTEVGKNKVDKPQGGQRYLTPFFSSPIYVKFKICLPMH